MIKELYPPVLWKHFDAICSIPHPSKHESKIVAYVKSFCEGLGLETIIDTVGNVIVRKPATKGFERKETVVLQAHLDMVPQRNNSVSHDFEKDPIVTRIVDGWVMATETTLGADNGIGVASILAILESKDLSHGPIEALFTIDEENGMTGAFKLSPDLIKGTILLNTDSEDDSELIVGCAGGVDISAHFKKTEMPTPDGFVAFNVMIKGLKGGHSGIDINIGRGNANVLLARLLAKVVKRFDAYVASFDGGNMRNAIPREAHALVCVNELISTDFLVFVKKFFKSYEIELKEVDEHLSISCKRMPTPISVFEPRFSYAFIRSLTCCPNGVIRMEPEIPSIVQTSVNLSIVESKEDGVHVHFLLRSSSELEKQNLAEAMNHMLKLFGASVSLYGSYPGWKPSVDSEILKVFKTVYPKVMGKQPEVNVIHAGLECGIIGDVYKGLDMISFGPTIKHPHSPEEKVNIVSVGRYWDLFVEILKNIPSVK